MMLRLIAGATILLALAGHVAAQETPSSAQGRLRVRDLGVKIGVYQPGPLNAITDVAGVRVGQVTLVEADAVHAYNAFGKLVGATQVNELGEWRRRSCSPTRSASGMRREPWRSGCSGCQAIRTCAPSIPWWERQTMAGSVTFAMHVKA